MSDHDATDEYMSGWLATCIHNGTRFYVTEDGLYTDDRSRAAWRRWASEADRVAASATAPGFPMEAATVAEVSAEDRPAIDLHLGVIVQPLDDPPSGVSWESWLAQNNRD
jgi:hypothetical protein